MCATSRGLNTRCVARLYQDVDLSHSLDCQCMVNNSNGCYHRQLLFMRTLNRHKDYANLIKSFKWTSMFNKQTYPPEASQRSQETIEVGISSAWWEMWDALMLLDNVPSVKITEVEGSLYGVPVYQNIALFSHATSISIAGYLSAKLADHVLHSHNLGRLQHLHFDNLQVPEHLVPYRTEDYPLLASCQTVEFTQSLTGRCWSLKSLTIKSTESLSCSGPRRLNDEWAAYIMLLGSTRTTLESLHFEIQDSRRMLKSTRWRIIDQLQRILHEGLWPRLRSVTVFPDLGNVDIFTLGEHGVAANAL